MATITFAPKTESANAEIALFKTEDTEVTVVQEKPLAVAPSGPSSGIQGEITSDDIKPPRLNLVQRVGNLGEQFAPGSFVYDKTFQITDDKTKELNATFLRFKKYYQQKLVFGAEGTPKRFDTAGEVRDNGGTTRWDEEAVKNGTYYAETADLLVAIESPETLDEDLQSTYFPYEHEGKRYGLVVYTITSSAFTSLGKRIITDATLLLRNGLYEGQYRLKSSKQTNATNSWFVPSASFDKKHGEKASAFFRQIAGF